MQHMHMQINFMSYYNDIISFKHSNRSPVITLTTENVSGNVTPILNTDSMDKTSSSYAFSRRTAV